jgi:hypothetical protein
LLNGLATHHHSFKPAFDSPRLILPICSCFGVFDDAGLSQDCGALSRQHRIDCFATILLPHLAVDILEVTFAIAMCLDKESR